MSNASQEPHHLPRLLVCIAVGAALWWTPTPAGLTDPAWHIFAVFAATIVSFLLRPLPMGVCVLVSLLTLTLTQDFYGATPEGMAESEASRLAELANDAELAEATVDRQPLKRSFEQSLSGFANTTTWLVVAAFLIAGVMIRSNLGRRLALSLISRLGSTTLGIGYAIAGAELLLGPFVPSNTARGGGVMAPIVNSLSHALGSTPTDRPERAGQYLVLVGAHTNLVVAALFFTGMAANPLVCKAAKDVLDVDFGWGTWLLGSIVPGMLGLAVLPWLLHRMTGPEPAGAAARDEARQQLAELGRWTGKQLILAGVLLAMLLLWMAAPMMKATLGYSLPTALVAFGGVVVLVVLGVEKWSNIVGNAAAWDTLVWLGGLLTMANALRDTGFTKWLADNVGAAVVGWPGVAMAVGLAVAYFFSMYAFSMLTGHILAFAAVLFAVGQAAGAPPLLLVPLVAYFSNLCGSLTNYSTGPVVIYFGLGYVPVGRWFAIGFVVSLLHLAIWLGVGLPYWKLLGWW